MLMLNGAYVDCMSLYICCHSQRVDAILKVTADDRDRGLRHDHARRLEPCNRSRRIHPEDK